jgi:hypothetical protein
MPRSTLDRTGEQQPILNKGPGTGMGPGDSSDPTSATPTSTEPTGTGERAAAGRDIDAGADVRPDRVEAGPDTATRDGDRSHARRRRTLRSLRRRRNSKNA